MVLEAGINPQDFTGVDGAIVVTFNIGDSVAVQGKQWHQGIGIFHGNRGITKKHHFIIAPAHHIIGHGNIKIVHAGKSECFAQLSVSIFKHAHKEGAIIILGGTIDVARHVPTVAGIANEGHQSVWSNHKMLSDGFSVTTGSLVKSGRIAALGIEKAIFGVLQAVDGVCSLTDQGVFIGVPHVVHHVVTIVYGVPNRCAIISSIPLIKPVDLIGVGDMQSNVVFVISAPGKRIPIQVFADHEGEIVAKGLIFSVIGMFAEHVVKSPMVSAGNLPI